MGLHSPCSEIKSQETTPTYHEHETKWEILVYKQSGWIKLSDVRLEKE